MSKINDFNSEAEYYDLLEQNKQPLFDSIINYLEKIFKADSVKNIIDFTCGTGAQAIPLGRKGFAVTGSDIADRLLEIAKLKSKDLHNINFRHGDVRFSKFGEFDAGISMLNSLGYLTRSDFKKALLNINNNLKTGGLFVFDNTNKGRLDSGNFATDKIINTSGESDGTKFIRYTKSKYDNKTGVITTEWNAEIQTGAAEPIKRSGMWSRQTYSKKEIEDIFDKTGFKLEQILDRNLNKFDPKNSFSYLVIGRKITNLK